jgi:translation initiation factor 4E
MSIVTFSLYNNIQLPSKLVVGDDFHCFKIKIETKWQDLIIYATGEMDH